MERVNWGRAPGILTEEEEARQLIRSQQRWGDIGKSILNLITPNQNVQPSAHDLAKRLTITTNKHPAPMDAMSIDALKKSRLAQIQQNEINKYRNALANSNTIAMGQVAPAAMSGAAQPMPEKKEEDEYGFLDAMFLANLVAGMQGGPPPTPYGTAVGGGNKTWASLPSLMRMS